MSRLLGSTFSLKTEGPGAPLISDFQPSAFVDLIETKK